MKRATRLPAEPVQIDYFGGLKPAGVINGGGFKGHDALKSWDDGGRAAQLAEDITTALQGLAGALKGYGAEQARDAVYDYVSGSYLDMALIEGHASIVFDVSNEAAQLRVHWTLEELLNKVVQDAIDRESYEIVDAVHRVCERTALMLNTMAQGEPEPVEPPKPAGRIASPRMAIPRSGNGLGIGAAVPAVRRTVPRG